LGDFGRPRRGFIAFNCVGVSGFASGSLIAAAVIALFSRKVGMWIADFLDIFDIVFYLSAGSASQADDPSHAPTIDKATK
jgi:hypothetical protein